MKRMLSAVLILVLLLCGCNYNTAPGGTQPSDILGSMPTNPITQPTNPTNESTVPTTEPTQPPTYPTEPEPTSVFEYRPEEGEWWWNNPNDALNLSFNKLYPIQIPVTGDKRIVVLINGPCWTDVTKYTALYNDEGKRAMRLARYPLYFLEEGGVARKIGRYDESSLGPHKGDQTVEATLADDGYELIIETYITDIWVGHGTNERIWSENGYSEFFRLDAWQYFRLDDAYNIRLVIPDYESVLSGEAEVKCYVVTRDGEIEISSTTDWPYGSMPGSSVLN